MKDHQLGFVPRDEFPGLYWRASERRYAENDAAIRSLDRDSKLDAFECDQHLNPDGSYTPTLEQLREEIEGRARERLEYQQKMQLMMKQQMQALAHQTLQSARRPGNATLADLYAGPAQRDAQFAQNLLLEAIEKRGRMALGRSHQQIMPWELGARP